MRRLFIVFMAVLAIAPIFADEEAYKRIWNDDIARIDTASDGLGGATLASSRDLFNNPSFLARQGFSLSVPYISARSYGVADSFDALASLLDGEGQELSGKIPAGSALLAEADAGIAFAAGGFGLDIGISGRAYSYGGEAEVKSLVNRMDAKLLMGYGHRFYGEKTYLDIGVSTGLYITGFNEAVDLGSADDDGSILDILKNDAFISMHYSIPVALSLDLRIPLDSSDTNGFLLSTAIRNPAAFSRSKLFDSLGDIEIGKLLASKQIGLDSSRFQIDAGISYLYEKDLVFRAAVEIKDIADMLYEFDKLNDTRNIDHFLNHFHAGIELGYKGIIARGGIDGASWTAGLTLDLRAIAIEAAYMRPFKMGEENRDMLSITMNIGWK